ncbi:MAG: alpha-galactosidase [Clostridia bacterium]|nr:alpha-galactosidase [Clostridia bacterium]
MNKKIQAIGSTTAKAAKAAARRFKALDVPSVGKLALQTIKFPIPEWDEMDNGLALTPPMGWSSWNLFRNKINEDLMLEIGHAMKDSGLLDAGYQYLNLDDCWQSSARDKDGKLQGDLSTFPSGIAALCRKLNALGLKVGIYSSNGTYTCEDMPASLGNESIDADTFAEWGIEYFKYDFCHNKPIPFRCPAIEQILLRDANGVETAWTAEQAVLSGNAKIVTDESLETGRYIDGLSGALGKAVFTCSVDLDSEYTLTICMRKKSNAYKYAEILVNGQDLYKITVPPTMTLTTNGRHQITIRLKAGINTISFSNPVASRQLSSAIQYREMGKQLQRATREYAEKTGLPEKKICYSVCEWGLNFPWRWGRFAGNLWRTTPDIKPFWASVLAIYEFNVRLAKYAKIGHWNDPDMLEVGNGSLTAEENRSHFTLWCMMASPLILGNDVRAFVKEDGTPNTDDPTYQIVTNRALIAIDQDALGIQCRRVKTSGVVDTLVKPLSGGEAAVCIFNKSSDVVCRSFDVREIAANRFSGLPDAGMYRCTELWEDSDYETDNTLSVRIPAHGVKVFRIRAIEPKED